MLLGDSVVGVSLLLPSPDILNARFVELLLKSVLFVSLTPADVDDDDDVDDDVVEDDDVFEFEVEVIATSESKCMYNIFYISM